MLKHDDYYKAHDEMTYEERTHLNYDHPNAFDTDLMLQHLRKLKKGEPINCPIYDYQDIVITHLLYPFLLCLLVLLLLL